MTHFLSVVSNLNVYISVQSLRWHFAVCVNLYCPAIGASDLVLQGLCQYLNSGAKVNCPGVGDFKYSGSTGLADIFEIRDNSIGVEGIECLSA
jgi:hypothetical protein